MTKKKKKKVTFSRKKVAISGDPKKRKLTAKSKARAASLAKIERTYPIELMLTDWSIKYPDTKPKTYLVKIKGYSVKEAENILTKTPIADWYTAKNELLDGVTASLAKRQIDWAAEMHDLHFEGSKMGLNCAMACLKEEERSKTKDIKNVKSALEAIQLAQKIQRTALGLPTDDGAIHIYNNLIMKQQQTTHVSEDEKTPVEKLEAKLTMEQIEALVEIRRIEKAKEISAEVIDV